MTVAGVLVVLLAGVVGAVGYAVVVGLVAGVRHKRAARAQSAERPATLEGRGQ